MKLTMKEVESISKLDHGLLLSNEISRAMAAQILKDQEALEFYANEAYVSRSGKVGIQPIYVDKGSVAKAALLPKE